MFLTLYITTHATGVNLGIFVGKNITHIERQSISNLNNTNAGLNFVALFLVLWKLQVKIFLFLLGLLSSDILISARYELHALLEYFYLFIGVHGYKT